MPELTIPIPDFRSMSDEDVRAHVLAQWSDGRWSHCTRYLLERFGTEKLELNEAWADTWWGWECPACGREKLEIARLTDKKILLCQLDLHHDHMHEATAPIIQAAIPADLADEVKRRRRAAFAHCHPLIVRFADTLVCNDCNAADGAMKNQLGNVVPCHFSFTPNEIRQFIVSSPNEPHKLEPDIGYEVLREAKPWFEDRLKFARSMATRIAAGRHDREVHRPGFPPSDHPRMLARIASTLPIRERPKDLRQALLDRSRATDGRASNRSAKPAPRLRVPTQAEFDVENEKRAHSGPWRRAGDDWSCPSCARSKFEIMRVSKSGGWIAQIMILTDYSEERDPESLQRRYRKAPLPLILGDRSELLVCQDCRQIITDAITLDGDRPEFCLRLEDLRSFAAEARPHQRHIPDPAEVAARIRDNEDWIAAVREFLIHLEEALDAYFAHYRLIRRTDLSAEAARGIVIPMLVSEGRLPAKDSGACFDWLVRERNRLKGK